MAISSLDLAWTENGTPLSPVFDDVYYSTDDALAEIEHIFISKNQLAMRFESADGFTIAETGFGTGLNFLVTAQLWLKNNPNGQLHFISFEKHPLPLQALAQAHSNFPELASESAVLRQAYPLLIAGWHQMELFTGRVKLTLWFGDVLQGLPEVETKVDAWFLDGFAPAKNPEMWQPPLYQQMARLSHLETTFATFTAAGDVRRGLESVGFDVKKATGFGKKREMCFGSLIQQRSFSSKTPWFDMLPAVHNPQSAIVIGAGIAGAAVAYALAEKGILVTVLEQNEAPAMQASSNKAGAIHPLVTADWNIRSQIYLAGLESTLRWLTPWLEAGEIEGELNGLLQLALDSTNHQRSLQAIERFQLPEAFIETKTANEASILSGQETRFDAVYFPMAGWVKPASVVNKCLSHSNIQFFAKKHVKSVQNTPSPSGGGRGKNSVLLTNNEVFEADLVVLTTGIDQIEFAANQPDVRPVKGQTSFFPIENPLFNTTVTHKGYSVSTPGGVLTGATFEAPSMSKETSLTSQKDNLDMLADAFPNLDIATESSSENVAFRPTVADHLPVVGALSSLDYLHKSYISQSHTHVVYRYPQQQYLEGVYVSNGHGARGLMSVFLAAEMIVAEVFGQQRLAASLRKAMHPAKYLIRDWRKGKYKSS